MKGARGLEEIKTRKNVKIPSAMPDSARSEYLELFLLEKEKLKLNKETEILDNQIELLNRRKKEKQVRLEEINGQMTEVVKSESIRLGADDMPQKANGAKNRLRVSHLRREEIENEPEDTEKQWRTMKLEY